MKLRYKKINFKKILDNKNYVKVLSIIAAILLWWTIVYSLYPETQKEISDIPVTINTQDERIKQLGLSVISGGETTVSVQITAKRAVIDSITADDIIVTASLNGVTTAGDASLELNAQINSSSSKEFTIDGVTPKYIDVKFGKYISKTFPVTVNVSGITIPEGYTMNSAIPNPLEVTVSGSQEDVEQVSKAVVNIDEEKELLTTETFTSQPIILLDAEGNEINNEHLKLDSQTADVKIPVLKKKEIPLKIEFLNVPTGFPTENLKYTISTDSITVAGPEAQIDNYNELVVGYVDISTLNIGATYTFDIDLPSEFLNVDNIKAVSVEFDTSDMSYTRFYVSNLTVVNAPAEYDVEVVSNSITVTIIGEEAILNNITAEDIVATIDLSDRDVITGEYKAPVKVSVPNKGLIWAYGDYTAVIRVTPKE